MEVDGRETSASICYTIRTIDEITCGEEYSDEKTCLGIPLTPIDCGPDDVEVNGEIETEGGKITYTITQKHYDCPTTDVCVCECTDVNTWTVPYYIDDDYPDDGEVKIYYEYWYTSAGTNTVCSREKRIGYSATTKGALPKEGDDYKNPIVGTILGEDNKPLNCPGDNCKYQAFVSKSSGCKSTPSTSLTVSISTNPTEVPGSEGNAWYIPSLDDGKIYDSFEKAKAAATAAGLTEDDIIRVSGKVTVIINFKKTIIDDKCNSRTESGSFTSATTIDPCPNNDITCCVDHNVEIKIPVETILGKIDLPNDTEVIYNGYTMRSEEDISFYVTQRRRYDGLCNGDCEYITTYCVDDSTVTVWYESQLGKGDWECFKEGCSGEKRHNVSCLPIYGGRIKVTWAYTAITYTEIENPACPTGETISVYEDYMTIGDCRDPFHPDEYQIYFKEQTPGCTTCEGFVMDEGPLAGKMVNTFTVTPCQDCSPDCDCYSIIGLYIIKRVECDCEDFEFVEPPCNCDDFNFIEPPCDCEDFEFVEPPCDCDDFEFIEPPCDCNDFEFIEPPCDCDDFKFIEPPCDCDDFKFIEPPCDCDSIIRFKLKKEE